MELTKQDIEKVKETINFITNKYEELADYPDDFDLQGENMDEILENENELPGFHFPGEQEYTKITIQDFLQIADEIPTIKIVNNSFIKTNHLSYYIVEAVDTYQNLILKNYQNLKLNVNEDVEINLVSDNFIIGLAAIETGEYDDDYHGTITPYSAIEVKYNTNEALLKPEKELEAVNSYIFEIADSTGLALTFSEIRNPYIDYEDLRDAAEEKHTNKLREIEIYNEGMKLFVSAIQIQENELKFLNFYKILEHFAPIAVNVEANELMRKKLDAPKSQFEDGDFIRSIFDLAKSMREKFNDEDLIKSTFSYCFDFIGLFERLPNSIKTRIKKQIGENTLNYSTEKQKLTTAGNMVGKIIYATRNRVVHAKSNFEITGNECEAIDLTILNEFMKEACSQTIRWYNRQPQHFKLAIIK